MASVYDNVVTNCGANIKTLGVPFEGTEAVCGMKPGATHFVIYPGPYPNYDHGGYLTDSNTTWNADEDYSDNNGGTWYSVSNSEHSIYTMFYAILYSSW